MVVYSQIRTSADVLQSTIRLTSLTSFLQQQQATACAIVNTTLHGLLPFARACEEANVHAVFGVEVPVQFADDSKAAVIFYAMNAQGYANLLKLSSAVETQGGFIQWRWLKSYHQGCIMAHHTTYDQLVALQQLAPDTVYTSVANDLGVPVIIKHPTYFLTEPEAFSYTIARKMAGEELMVEDVLHYCAYTKEQWEAMQAELRQTTEQMLMRCQVTPPVAQYMPKFPVVEQSAEQMLQQLAFTQLKQRLHCEELPTTYHERLSYELEVIITMGYADYFLIVADFMQFAREKNILTGPGRGSSASSLVAYALAITHVDPLQYGLLFERFLNHARRTLPDIDIDFVDSRRQTVIQYVAQKYGKLHVAQISTTGTLAMRAAAREVARAMDFDANVIDYIAKLLPRRESTLQEAYQGSAELRQFIAANQAHQLWWQTACQLEGLPRNQSIHAAGIVLSPVPIIEVAPIQLGNDELFATQWAMQEVEQAGLLKIDFLGLRNLTILAQIRWLYYQQYRQWLDFNTLPLDDAATFTLLQQGDTTGVFQLESAGMREALGLIQPTNFLDIVAVSALHRPGPRDFIPLYARRKHGEEPIVMPHPDLAPILTETYGVIVYQEQILQIATTFAGMSIGEADILRRAISKKDSAQLNNERSHFITGALNNGYDEKTATTIFEMIVRFANYGFVKSHAVAYSLISYQLAFMKANYPSLFYAALLTNAVGDATKTQTLLHEAKRHDVLVKAPDINQSERYYTTVQTTIFVGLAAIKNVPKTFIQTLLATRKEEGAFTSIFDMAMKLSAEHFNEKAITQLIYAGALDSLNQPREVLLATVKAAKAHAKLHRKTQAISLAEAQRVMFGTPKHEKADTVTLRERLQWEKDALGFYVSEHPLTAINQASITAFDIEKCLAGTQVKWFGIVQDVKVLRTKKGEQMAFVQVEDEFAGLSVTVFPKVYRQAATLLIEETIICVQGVVEHRNGKVQIQAKQITTPS